MEILVDGRERIAACSENGGMEGGKRDGMGRLFIQNLIIPPKGDSQMVFPLQLLL